MDGDSSRKVSTKKGSEHRKVTRKIDCFSGKHKISVSNFHNSTRPTAIYAALLFYTLSSFITGGITCFEKLKA